ncbi:MAG: glycosyltransferase family 39 protein [Candidatus Nanohaloarchaea archaeon]|nr:glycosyltransferase family 39 protein [Candidatus Nanohaloarchaea archaeon]
MDLPPEGRSNRQLLYGLLALFLVLGVAGSLTAPLEWDEGSFLLNAEHFAGEGANFEPSRPAAMPFLISLVWQFTGESVLAARLLVLLSGIGCVLVFHRIASEEFEDPLLLTAGLAMAPLTLFWSFHAYTDVPALLFLLTSYHLHRRGKHVLSGVAMAAAVTFRYLYALFAFGMAVSYILRHRDRFLEYLSGGLLGSIPFFYYSTRYFGGPLSRARMYVSRVSRWSGSGVLAAPLGNLQSAVLMLSTLLPAAWLGRKGTPLMEKLMVLSYATFLAVFSGNTYHRYWLPVLPFLLLMGRRGLDRRNFAAAVAGMLIISGFGVWTVQAQDFRCKDNLNDAIDYLEDREGAVVSDQWAVTGYLLDREVHSPWTDYSTLHSEHGARYALTTDELPYHLEESFAGGCWTWRVYSLNSSTPSS